MSIYVDTEYLPCGTAVDDTSGSAGTISWSDPNNVKVDDGNYSTVVLSGTELSHYLKLTNFGFSIPDSATNIQVNIKIKGKVNTGNGAAIDDVRIILADTIDETQPDSNFPRSGGFTDSEAILSGTNNIPTLSYTDVNDSGFGIAIKLTRGQTNPTTLYLNYITISIGYDYEPTPTFTLTYTAESNGSITGTTPQTINQGSDGTSVTATPNTGYTFVRWSDGVYTQTRRDLNITKDISATASFTQSIPYPDTSYLGAGNGPDKGISFKRKFKTEQEKLDEIKRLKTELLKRRL